QGRQQRLPPPPCVSEAVDEQERSAGAGLLPGDGDVVAVGPHRRLIRAPMELIPPGAKSISSTNSVPRMNNGSDSGPDSHWGRASMASEVATPERRRVRTPYTKPPRAAPHSLPAPPSTTMTRMERVKVASAVPMLAPRTTRRWTVPATAARVEPITNEESLNGKGRSPIVSTRGSFSRVDSNTRPAREVTTRRAIR